MNQAASATSAARVGFLSVRAWALLALAGIGAYLFIDATLAFIDPWYSLVRNAESDYGVGAHAWLMDVNFLIRGAFSLAAGIAIASSFPARRSRTAGVVALLIWAAASAGLAFFPDQPLSTGQIHLVLAGVAFTAVAAGTMVLSRSLSGEPGLGRYALPLTIVSVLGLIAWVATVALTKSPIAWFGLVERAFLGLEILWIGIVMAGVLALSARAGEQR